MQANAVRTAASGSGRDGQEHPRVCVVGAGMAGLAAVQGLLEQGCPRHKITVVEASARIGGRVKTVECQCRNSGTRFPFDEGAAWIHGSNPANPLNQLASKYGVGLKDIAEGGNPWMEPRHMKVAVYIDGIRQGEEERLRGLRVYEALMKRVGREAAAQTADPDASLGALLHSLLLDSCPPGEGGEGDDSSRSGNDGSSSTHSHPTNDDSACTAAAIAGDEDEPDIISGGSGTDCGCVCAAKGAAGAGASAVRGEKDDDDDEPWRRLSSVQRQLLSFHIHLVEAWMGGSVGSLQLWEYAATSDPSTPSEQLEIDDVDVDVDVDIEVEGVEGGGSEGVLGSLNLSPSPQEDVQGCSLSLLERHPELGEGAVLPSPPSGLPRMPTMGMGTYGDMAGPHSLPIGGMQRIVDGLVQEIMLGLGGDGDNCGAGEARRQEEDKEGGGLQQSMQALPPLRLRMEESVACIAWPGEEPSSERHEDMAGSRGDGSSDACCPPSEDSNRTDDSSSSSSNAVVVRVRGGASYIVDAVILTVPITQLQQHEQQQQEEKDEDGSRDRREREEEEEEEEEGEGEWGGREKEAHEGRARKTDDASPVLLSEDVQEERARGEKKRESWSSSTIRFCPPLPAVKQSAFDRATLGSYKKVLMEFVECFWPTDVPFIALSSSEPAEERTACASGSSAGKTLTANANASTNGSAKSTRAAAPTFSSSSSSSSSVLLLENYAYLKEGAPPVLTAILPGDAGAAVSGVSDTLIVESLLARIRRTFTQVSRDVRPVSVRVTRWDERPFSLGAYSFSKVGSSPFDLHDRAKSVGKRLYFAGEATSVDYEGSLHGAYLTGRRAAREVHADWMQ